MGQSSSSNAGTPQRPSPAMVRSDVATAAAAASGTGEAASEVTHAEALQEEDDGEDSFNYNSESSEDDKFPTAVVLQLPEVKLEDPVINVDSSMKRVAKDFIGSN